MSRVVVVGSLNLDRVAEVARLPLPGETVTAGGSRLDRGGKGANQAFAAATTAPTGVEVAMIGCVGDDGDGTDLIDDLAASGVDVAGIERVPGPSGQAFILVDAAGENQIVVVPGANHRWNERAGMPTFTSTEIVVLQGEIPLGTILEVIEAAHAAGARVVLNAAPFQPGLVEALGGRDVLVVNESEAVEAFACAAVDAPGRLAELGGPFDLVVTLGADGAIVSTAPHDGAERIPAHAVTAVDTVGAGDAFVGALASALGAGAGLADAARRGAAAASIVVSSTGTRSVRLDRAAVDRLLAQESAC